MDPKHPDWQATLESPEKFPSGALHAARGLNNKEEFQDQFEGVGLRRYTLLAKRSG